MRWFARLAMVVAALAVGACGGSESSGDVSTGGIGATASVGADGAAGVAAAPTQVAVEGDPPATSAGSPIAFPRCDPNAKLPSAPEDWYRETPRYVGNEQPIEAVRAWALSQPGFQEVWIDRDHNGWVAVGFNRPVDEVQVELERRFPGDGVVAVELDWNLGELRALQQRVGRAVADARVSAGVGVSMAEGLVDVHFGVLSEEALAALDGFEGEPICVSGLDAALARVGPQAASGDGWRLLAIDGGAQHRRSEAGQVPAQPAPGEPPPTPGGITLGNRIELATSQRQYDASWSAALNAIDGGFIEVTEQPPVDFETEVAVFGHTLESGSCPLLVFGIVVDDSGDSAAVVIDTGTSDEHAMCTADGNPVSWAIAIERSAFPEPPFVLSGHESALRTGLWVVDDLRQPGLAVDDGLTIGLRAGAGQPTPAPLPGFQPDPRPAAPPPPVTPTPGHAIFPHVLEPGFPSTLEVPRACFVGLGPINDYVWAPTNPELLSGPPDDWLVVEVDGALAADVLLTSDPGGEPTLDVTVAGRTERYTITTDPPSC